jgi:hypothetical protein
VTALLALWYRSTNTDSKFEQHGFRKAENIQDALNSELFFYGKCWGFSPSDDLPVFTIDNL